jgi:hypothetical protein
MLQIIGSCQNPISAFSAAEDSVERVRLADLISIAANETCINEPLLSVACKHALNKSGDDWNTEFQNKFWLEEVRKRSLSVKDCAALLVARGVDSVGANTLRI